MAKAKQYIDKTVYEAAKERIAHIADTHDTLVVCFSGGKDSLVTLHLTKEVLAERGIDKVNVVFRDEEVIPTRVIDFVNKYRQEEWCNLDWYAIPLASQKFILGQGMKYVQWDNKREHVREKPAWSIVLEDGDNRVFDQYTTDAFIAEQGGYAGKIAFLTGIRADESLIRFRASVEKLNENYINASSSPRVSLCKPIYDWTENDIFKYLGENKIEYCEIYDSQFFAGEGLRVSTPLHAESSKRINRLREIDPQFYDQVLRVFPEMQVQDRYWSELDRAGLNARYGQTYDDIWEYVKTIEDKAQRIAARKALRATLKRAKVYPDAYPPKHVFNYILTGSFKRNCMPISKNQAKRNKKNEE